MITWHPHADDFGQRVTLHSPSKPSLLSTWPDANAVATAVPGQSMPDTIPHETWQGLEGNEWEVLAGTMQFKEPLPSQQVVWSAGALVFEEDGRVWLITPSNRFGGYDYTFPKGKQELDCSLKATALKEVWEESGLKVQLTAWLGDFPRTTSTCRMYLASRVSGNPADMGWESQAVHLVPEAKLNDLLAPIDQSIIATWREWKMVLTS